MKAKPWGMGGVLWRTERDERSAPNSCMLAVFMVVNQWLSELKQYVMRSGMGAVVRALGMAVWKDVLAG